MNKTLKIYLYEVEIPPSLAEQPERSKAYAAGFLLFKRDRVIKNLPKALRPICKRYGGVSDSDLNRASLHYPEVTLQESSYWAGYLTAEGSSRDKTRSGATSRQDPDTLEQINQLRKGRRSLDRELSDLFHLSDE